MKKIISVMLVLAMMLCLFACNNDKKNPEKNDPPAKDEKTTYTVRVIDDKGNPVAGVRVTFCPKGSTEVPWPTDAEGKAEYKSSKEMTVKLTEAPAGFEYDKINFAQSFDENNMLTIVLSAKAEEEGPVFLITVVDQNGDPVVGASVAMCDMLDSCRTPVTTDSEGNATYPLEDGEFKAKIISLPEGYEAENLGEYEYFVDGKVTFTVTKK